MSQYYIVARFKGNKQPVYIYKSSTDWEMSHSRAAILSYSLNGIERVAADLRSKPAELEALKVAAGQFHNDEKPSLFIMALIEQDLASIVT